MQNCISQALWLQLHFPVLLTACSTALLHIQHLFAEITLIGCNYNGQTTFDSADKWLFQSTWSGRKMPVILCHAADPHLPLTVLWIFNCRLSLCAKAVSWVQTHRTQLSRCSAYQEALGTQNRDLLQSALYGTVWFTGRGEEETKHTQKHPKAPTPILPPHSKKDKKPCSHRESNDKIFPAQLQEG